MIDIIKNIDWWSLIILPMLTYLGKKVADYLNSKKYNQYVEILKDTTMNVVKEIYETQIKDIKHTSEWTKEKQEDVKLEAIDKIRYGLSDAGYKVLTKSNVNFNEMVDTLIGTCLYNLKNK